MPDPTPTNDHLPTSIFDHSDAAVEDIFSDSAPVTSAPSQQAPQVGVAVHQPAPAGHQELPSIHPVGGSPGKKIALWGGLGVGLIGITAFVAYMLIKTIGGGATPTPTVNTPPPAPPVVAPTPEPTPVVPTPAPPASTEQPIPVVPPPIEVPVLTPPPLDTDSDGISDTDEQQLRTNPNLPDTDFDGLTDREETQTYRTNPLSTDTDGDGFLDGEEVKKGFNPNGPGKLLPPPVPNGASLNP